MLSLLVESTQDFQSKLIEVMSEESNMQDQINMLFRDLNAAWSRLSEVRMIRNRSRGIPGISQGHYGHKRIFVQNLWRLAKLYIFEKLTPSGI